MLFSLHWQTYKILYPLLFPLFYLLRQICYDKMENNNIVAHPFVMTTLMFVSELVCGILEPLRICFSRNSHYKEVKQELPQCKTKIMDKLEQLIKSVGNVIVEMIAILVIALLDYGGFIIITFTNISGNILSFIKDKNSLFFINDLSAAVRMSEILFLSLLTAKIFGYNIYKHHKFARLVQMINIILLSFFIFILVIFCKSEDNKRYLAFFISIVDYLISFFLFSCKNICIKWMIEKRFYSPFLLLFYVGLAGLFCIAITFLITKNFIICQFAFCKEDPEQPKAEIKIETTDIIYLSSSFLCGSIINLFQYLTNQYFDPCYIGIGDSLAGFLLWFYYFFTSSDFKHFNVYYIIYWILIVLCGLLYIFSFFACLVYTENIICHFNKLNENVTYKIAERAKEEVENSQEVLSHEISLIAQEPLMDANSNNANQPRESELDEPKGN